jgi:hypothetical protein
MDFHYHRANCLPGHVSMDLEVEQKTKKGFDLTVYPGISVAFINRSKRD